MQRETGSWGRVDAPQGLMAGLAAGKPPADTDSDGIPDSWERKYGLDPQDAADAGQTVGAGKSPLDRHQGYTYLEFYLNALADELAGLAVAEWESKNRD